MKMKKQLQRILALIIAMATLLSTATFAASPEEFADFPNGWSKEAMTAAVENELLKGDNLGLILPKANLSRAQMATIINRAFGAQIEANIADKYIDVAEDDWFYSEIAKAVNMQTFSGLKHNVMSPALDITREEVMVVIARALLLDETEDLSSLASFSDKDEISGWAQNGVAAMTANGYVNGYEDGTLRVKNTVTREEFAQILHNIFGMYIAKAGTYTEVPEAKSVMINVPGVTLKDVTINGDLVIGDGVGDGEIVIENVKVNGRIVVRGGHGKISFKSVTCTDKIYVKDVNGTVYFYNYETEALFSGMVAKTPVKFREKVGGSTGGGTVTPPAAETAKYYVKTMLQNINDDTYQTVKVEERIGNVGSTITVEYPATTPEGFHQSSASVLSGTLTKNTELELKICYDRNEYDITFIGTDPSAKVVETLRYGSYYPFPASLEAPAAGYVFGGWYTEENGLGTKILPTDKVTATDNLYAYFIPEENIVYTVLYMVKELDGTYSVYDTEYYFDGKTGETVTATPIAIPNFTYDASISNASGTVLGDGSLELKLYYARNSYKITFDIEGTTSDIDVLYEDVITFPAAPAKAGYTFDGWCTLQDGSGAWYVNGDTAYEPLTLYAIFTANYDTPYTVEHYLQNLDGTYSLADTENLEGETDSTVTANQGNYTGFTFDAAASTVSGTVTADGGLVLKLYYTRNTDTAYTVEHYTQNVSGYGFELSDTEALSGKTGETVTATPKTYTGFVYDTSSVASGEIAEDGTLVIKLYYARVAYDIVFNANGVSVPVTALYGQNYPIPATDPAKDGYVFAGWYTQENGLGTKIVATDTLSGNVTTINLYAYFIAEDDITYKAEHYLMDLDGNYTILNETDYGTDGVTDQTVTASPKSYTGFTYNASISTASGTILADGSLVLKLYYERNKYNITFDVEGVTNTVPVYYGANYPFPTDPEKFGYTFDGWFTQAVGGTKILATDTVSETKTLYAQFTAGTGVAYKIEHYLQGLDGAYTTAEKTENKLGTVDETVTATQETFEGFTFDAAASTVSGTVAADGGLVLKLYYTRNLYTVIFYDEDTELDRVDVLYGATIPAAEYDAICALYAEEYKNYKNEKVGETVLPTWVDINGYIFDDEAVITESIDLYLGYMTAGAYVSVDIDNSKLTFAHTYAPSVLFDETTTFIDALKYFVHGNRNYNLTAVKEVEAKIPQDIKDKVYSKNIIDEDKNINFIKKKVSIVELHATEDEFKDKLVDEVEKLFPPEDIPDDIQDITHDFVHNLTTTGTVEVNPGNKIVAEAAVEILENITIEELEEHLDEATINAIGKDKLEDIFLTHKDDYIQSLKDAIAAAGGPVTYMLRSRAIEYHEITTWITVAVDPVEDVLRPRYDKMRNKVEDIMSDKGVKESTREKIRELMDFVSIESLFDYDAAKRGDPKSEEPAVPTGYSIRAYERYYNILEDAIPILEELALDLEDNYDYDEREEIVDKVINKICDEYLDKINEYLDKAADKLLDYTDRVDLTDKDITAEQIKDQRQRALKLVLTDSDITLIEAFEKFIGDTYIEKTYKGQNVKLYWEYEIYYPEP